MIIQESAHDYWHVRFDFVFGIVLDFHQGFWCRPHILWSYRIWTSCQYQMKRKTPPLHDAPTTTFHSGYSLSFSPPYNIFLHQTTKRITRTLLTFPNAALQIPNMTSGASAWTPESSWPPILRICSWNLYPRVLEDDLRGGYWITADFLDNLPDQGLGHFGLLTLTFQTDHSLRVL